MWMDYIHRFLAAPEHFLVIYVIPFIVVLSVLVFVHEWGHYIVARLCGVKVETFSIGFGKEMFGWTDKAGTRWKVSWLPFGGYVQMFGDTDPASARHEDDKKAPLTEEEKKVAFYTQRIAKRSAIVAAGPAVNFIFAIFILTGLYTFAGQPYTPPVVGKLVAGSPADKAGIRPDDKILYLNDTKITRFQDMTQFVSVNLDKPVTVRLVHAIGKHAWSKKVVVLHLTPALIHETDRFGFKSESGQLGIYAPPKGSAMIKHTFWSAFIAANEDVWDITVSTLQAIGQMIEGTRSANELGGILRIGAYAGDFAQQGIVSLISFAALLSINLGLINILPVPLLDGGHLAFYAMETVRGKPPSARFQEYALRVGLAFILGIMLFSTWNDLIQLNIIAYVKNHIF